MKEVNTHKVEITVGDRLFNFSSEQDWINTARRKFQNASVTSSDVICVDSQGRICESGREFMRAEKESAYPVWVYRAVI